MIRAKNEPQEIYRLTVRNKVFKTGGIMLFILKTIFLFGFLLTVGSVQAKPLEVIYKDQATTKFKWHWPYQTRRTTNYLQTKPYFYTGRLINVANENVSKYRFYYTQKTCKNDWGYFFHPGDKLCSHEILHFPSPQPQDRVNIVRY